MDKRTGQPENADVRRLAAIVATDVVNYSRHIAEDEASTLTALREIRAEIMDPALAHHGGRLVKLMGDGTLVEFGSAVSALECAAAIQRAMAERNAARPGGRHLQLRIGINVGDIVIERDAIGSEDIYGEGVNIAARLQEIANPGGIAVSNTVVDHVREKVALGFDPLGAPQLKNISHPVRVFAVRLDDRAPPTVPLAAVLERPAVAILPFRNMSGDAAQEYFADGITEDLITALSAWRWFPVIARNSTFAFKGRTGDVTDIGKALAARYVVEGRVQRAADRLRIGVQLVDAGTGLNLWAQHYDRRFGDVFEVQDEITRAIVGAIEPQLTRAEERRAARQRPENLDSWDLSLQALAQLRKGSPSSLAMADQLLDRAVAMDPQSSYAQSLRALTRFHGALIGWSMDPAGSLASTYAAAQAAVTLDDCDWLAHALLGIATLWNRRDFETANREEEMAIALNPSAALAYNFHGCVLTFDSRPAAAIPQLRTVLQLDPRFPLLSGTLADLGLCHLLLGDFDEAVRWCERAIAEREENVRAWQRLAAALGQSSRTEAAQAALGRVFQLLPEFGSRYLDTTYPFRDAAHTGILREGLCKAGWTG
ncbi:MAG TPA: adenylate/guanylate cyclase domain-containing protein [Verrucomicrobiae bacterium]|nr:adenylate/guanylate cyclase domain-containing protein [Verrucomicrobiae bacterium]